MNLEHINCPFCNSDSHRIIDTLDGYNIVKCKTCGFKFTNPRPYISDLPDFYDEEYYKDERFLLQYYNKDGTINTNETDFDAGIVLIENYVSARGSVLEIGCATGIFLKQLKKRGWKTFGIEISTSACNIAKELNKIDVFCGSLKDFDSPVSFDVIIMQQTLEHLPDPKFVLQKASEILNHDGILVISVPNIKSFDIKISKSRKRNSYDLPRHLSHFDHNFLKKQLHDLGFDILEIDLYYPKFILTIVNFINSKRKTKKHLNNIEPIKSDTNFPELLKYKISLKGKLLKKISNIFPGWKFTIIAKKK